MIDTNQPSSTVQPIPGLSVVINRNSTAGDQASDPAPHGTYGEICFVTPVELDNEPTNNATMSGYRAFCGVRYYVAKAAVDDGGRRSVLGNLVRVSYKTGVRGAPSGFYNNPWSSGSGLQTNYAVLAENVLCFRVQPAENDTTQGLKPLNPQMFKDMDGDQNKTINYQNFSGKNPCYPGVYIGLCVVDSRTAGRINDLGLNAAAKMAGFYTTTNWVLVRFENFKP
jgi:hypothetical protein